MIELRTKNCNGNVVEYKFNSESDFIFKFNKVSYENDSPMLDDEVVDLKINGFKVCNGNLKIVNDLYELLEGSINK